MSKRKLSHELKQKNTVITRRESAKNKCPDLSQRGLWHLRNVGTVRSQGGLDYLGIYYQTLAVDQPKGSCRSEKGKRTRESNTKEEAFYLHHTSDFTLTTTHTDTQKHFLKSCFVFLTGATEAFSLGKNKKT